MTAGAWRAAAQVAFSLVLTTMLGGCVMFERAPMALSCDPDLVGRWLPLPAEGQQDTPLGPDDYADVQPGCRALLSDAASGQSPRFNALGFRDGGHRYLAFGRQDLDSLFRAMPEPPHSADLAPEAVFLTRYRIQDDVLEVALPNLVQVLGEMADLTVATDPAQPTVRMFEGTPDQLLALLRQHPDLFDDFDRAAKVLRMRRAPAADADAP